MKMLIIAALVAGFAMPAFAQSFDPDNGSGNIVWRHAPVNQDGAAAQKGDSSYASAPKMGFTGNRSIKTDDVDRTGGGSPGYNELLKQY
jgi:hypothetical protein